MATNKDRIQALKDRRKQIDDALAKGEQIIDALKGRKDEQSRARRATVHATAEKLHAQKEALSARIKEMEGADNSDDTKALREELKRVQEQQKARSSALADQITSIRERIEAAVGDNKLLSNLVAKERLSMQIKFNEKVLRLIDGEQRKALSDSVREQSERFAKIEKDLSSALKDAGEAHGDDPDVRDAERRARELAKDIAGKEAEMDDLAEELADADTDEARDAVQKKIDALSGEIDGLYAKREEGRKKKREEEKPKGKEDRKGDEKKDEPSEQFDVPSVPDDADEEAKKLKGELDKLKDELGKLDSSKSSDQYGVLKVAFKNKRATLLKRLEKK